jgi:neopullulanase
MIMINAKSPFLRISISVLLLLIFATSTIRSQPFELQRVEPPSWWAGMKNSELQLLVYGENISRTTPTVDYPGAEVLRFTTLESPNYLFVDLNISEEAQPGTVLLEFKHRNTTVAAYSYELKARHEGSAQRQGFDQRDVIYLLFPDRFANGNPENDSHPEMLEKVDRSNPDGRHGGDIKGISNHLDYISDLGFTAVWINPLLENNQAAYSYHGYAISDFYRIDPRFGTNEEYLELVNQMHEQGIKVIKDMIFNHCGINHWWMNDLPSADWINQFDDFTRSNFRGGTVFDPYAADHDLRLFQKGWFDTNMPDLNQENEFLMNYLIQNSIWWIEYAGLDGIRMDTYPYPEKEAMKKWAQRVMEEYPDFSIVGEAWLSHPAQVATWQQGDKLDTGYESSLNYVFDFPMYDAFRWAFNEDQGWSNGLVRFYDLLTQDYLYQNPFNIVTFADNHDGDRIFSKLNENLNSLKMAMTFLLTTRGVPQIYYGTEILMTGRDNRGHGAIRKDFPGGWPGDMRNAFTAEGRTKKENEAFNHIRTLLQWRKENEVIHSGKLKHFIPENNVYVYFRYNNDKTVMVILNNNEKSQHLENKRFLEITVNYSTGKNVPDQKVYDLNDLIVPAKTGLILELQ